MIISCAPRDRDILRNVPRIWLGGLPIALLDRAATTELMVTTGSLRGARPVIMTSANGEVISRCRSDVRIAALFAASDLISADGQSMVIASRFVSEAPLPERVATTDLFHDVARRAQQLGLSFYLFGATEDENRKAYERVRELYPQLKLVGRSNGYLAGEALERRIAEIDRAAPDIVWVGLGVPRQQAFCAKFANSLRNVGILKTCGGLFNFLSARRARAPLWMQQAGLEWAFRTAQEPRRLMARHLITSPHAIYLLARSRKLVSSFRAV